MKFRLCRQRGRLSVAARIFLCECFRRKPECGRDQRGDKTAADFMPVATRRAVTVGGRKNIGAASRVYFVFCYGPAQ